MLFLIVYISMFALCVLIFTVTFPPVLWLRQEGQYSMQVFTLPPIDPLFPLCVFATPVWILPSPVIRDPVQKMLPENGVWAPIILA